MNTLKSRVLVVDDEPEIVNLLSNFLSRKGYDVSGASSGEEALDILDEKRTDLVLLDIKMPGIQGTEVAKIVKEKYPHIKIIVVTGYAEEAESLSRDNLLAGLFVKPIQLQDLHHKLTELVNPSDGPIITQQGLTARVLLIKSRLLFLEPAREIYNFLNTHFKKMLNRGENYEMDVIDVKQNLNAKIAQFHPDILVVNAAALKGDNLSLLNAEISEQNFGVKGIVLYNIENLHSLQQAESEKLIKSVQAVCLRNGLIEIKWVEI